MSRKTPAPEPDQSDMGDNLPSVMTRRPPTLQPSPDSSPMEWPNNFDLATVEGRAALINASNVPDWIPSDGASFTLSAVHYLVMPAEIQDMETGEVRDGCSVIFADRDGRTARFTNDWSARRLHAMMALFTPEQWRTGIVIECFAKASRRKGRTYGSFRVLRLAPTSTPNQES